MSPILTVISIVIRSKVIVIIVIVSKNKKRRLKLSSKSAHDVALFNALN
jgi:hypothetical protein